MDKIPFIALAPLEIVTLIANKTRNNKSGLSLKVFYSLDLGGGGRGEKEFNVFDNINIIFNFRDLMMCDID